MLPVRRLASVLPVPLMAAAPVSTRFYEVICSARTSSGCVWYVLRFDSIHNDYKQVWVSNFYPNTITCIKLFDINGDGIYEVLVGFDNGKVIIYSGTNKSIIAQITLPLTNSVNDIEFGDVDNDGIIEIGISNDSKISLQKENYTLKSQILYGAYDFKIGNVTTIHIMKL